MKKLSICIIGLALIAAASFQVHAWFNVGMVGGGVPAAAPSCTPSNDTELVTVTSAGAATTATFVNIATPRFRAQSFQVANNFTLTEYEFKGERNNTGDARISLHADSSGSPAATPVSGTTWDEDDTSGWSTSSAQIVATLSTPKTGLSASTTYWIVWSAPSTGGYDIYLDGTDNYATYTGKRADSLSGPWSTESYDFHVIVRGCTE